MDEIEQATWRGKIDEKLRQVTQLTQDVHRLSVRLETIATKQTIFGAIIGAVAVYMLGKFYLKLPI